MFCFAITNGFDLADPFSLFCFVVINTSSFEDMRNMFEDAASFNQDLDQWDVSHCFSFVSGVMLCLLIPLST